MSYGVDLTKKAEDDLARLPKNQAQIAVNRLRRLGENAETVRHRALATPFRGVFSLRIGNYRALYTLDHAERKVVVHMIRHRSEVYRT